MATTHPILLDLPMPIRTKRLLLRPVGSGDGKMLNEAIVETWDHLKKWLQWAQGDIPKPSETEEVTRRFYADFILRKGLHLAIFHNDHLIGMCGFRHIDWEVPRADVGYWIRTSAQRQGFAREAIAALTRYGFNEMHLRRITISIDDKNERSIAVAENLGFSLEARALGLVHPLRPDSTPPIGRIYTRFDEKNLPS
jgi:RimJ/RimL family protein N-acetyltransferase